MTTIRREFATIRRTNLALLVSRYTRPKAHRPYGTEPTRHAAFAWELAKVRIAFAALEAKGLARLVQEPDDCCEVGDLGDDYTEPSRDAHPEAIKAWKRRMRALDSDGVWYFCAEVLDPVTGRWEQGDGIGGFVGELTDDYEFDLKASALRAYHEAVDARDAAMAREMEARGTYAAGSSEDRHAAE